MTKSKQILVIIGILVLCGGLLAGLLLVQQQQNLSQKAAPSTSLYLSPASQNLTPGSAVNLTVRMDTASNAVTGIDIRLNFDPNVLEITSVTQGSGITNLNQTITNTINNTTGKVQYAVFTLSSANAVSGQGVEVLRVSGIVKSNAPSGASSVSFDPQTAASAYREGQNIIIAMVPATVTVASGTPLPTTNPTNSPAPTAPGATATPMRTFTPTPLPTATTTTTTPHATATATSMPIPVTGTEWTTYFGITLGVMAIIAAILLAI